MKYLLLSDIHGSLPRLRTVLDIYRKERCDMLLLLGDIMNYGPRNSLPEGLDARGVAEELNKMRDEIVAVRGNCDSEVDQMLLLFPILATYAVVVDEGRKILLTHGHVYNRQTLPPGHFDAVVYGHTHLWELTDMVSAEDGRHTVICNTGSITFPKGGKQPTFGIMDNGVISIRDLDNNILAEHKLT
ncbi:MAG: phosphodiesterase [Prevotella sp.]|uniref:phosphodiesterase n=1 Tax=Prevotella sp. TaxID=59823 RepID=UPI002A93DBAE|nr:phosphodiesterase [Prevotella sp.]MDY5313481.1 phosphodiesterase [Prevotella sp.]